MEENDPCYTFKEYTFTDGLLNASVDATYIVHLKENGRMPDIEKQLSEYHPTNTLFLVLNKGYKKCNKILLQQKSSHDLVDSYLHIFRHAKHMKYNNILILEDDFIFSPDIKESTTLNYLNTHLKSSQNDNFLYYLGCIPIITSPYDSQTMRVHIGMVTHAVIYSKSFRDNMLKQKFAKGYMYDWDLFIQSNMFNRYAYYKPLCYQIFPKTENRSKWDFFMTEIVIDLLNLENNHEPGTSILYLFSKIFSGFILVLLIYMVVCVFINFSFIQRGIIKYFKKLSNRLSAVQ